MRNRESQGGRTTGSAMDTGPQGNTEMRPPPDTVPRFPGWRRSKGSVATVTPNPALDRTLRVDELAFGGIARVQAIQEDPGGKGINVSRVLRSFGCPTTAMGFLGGPTGQRIAEALAALAIEGDFTTIPGESRTNLTVTDGTHEIKVNEPGPGVPHHAVDALITRVRQRAGESLAVVLSGSLPPGVPAELYAELIRIIREAGAKPVLDTAGVPLAHGVAARPYLIKPNRHETEALLGMSLETDEALREAACRLSGYAIPVVVISLGARGAVCACGEAIWLAETPPVAVASTVGAGDALLACLLLALLDGQEPPAALRIATAAGAASAALPGSRLCTPAELNRMLPQVRLRRL
jgi:1-phosphofructokinase